MKQAIILPNTPMCKVVYTHDGTNYGAIMPTPKDADDLRIAMLSRPQPVSAKQLVRVEPVQPRGEIHRGHPAAHNIARYATVS
jgi:hypothetical protein